MKPIQVFMLFFLIFSVMIPAFAEEKEPFQTQDKWGREQKWTDEDEDGNFDTVTTYGFDNRIDTVIRMEAGGKLRQVIRWYQDERTVEYADENEDGIMDTKTWTEPDGTRIEEEIQQGIVYNPDFGTYQFYSQYNEDGMAEVRESYDRNRVLRQRITYNPSGQAIVEDWDAQGRPVQSGSWSPEKDWFERTGQKDLFPVEGADPVIQLEKILKESAAIRKAGKATSKP